MDRFVCVRLVQMKGLDLGRLQFDGDQTLAAFLLEADGTVLGRWGSRSAGRKESEKEISLAGFRAALEGALELHAGFPGNREALAGKQGGKVPFSRVEQVADLRERMKEDLPRGCIHCHNVPEAERKAARAARKPLPEPLMYPYPMPERLGLRLDRDTRAVVKSVDEGSAAAAAGLAAGDRLLSLEGQPLLSTADVQWVLHHAPDEGRIGARILRKSGKEEEIALALAPGWRKYDSTWRESFWQVRPGFNCVPAEGGLSVKFIFPNQESGKAARKAGLQQGDLVVEVDGKPAPATETEFLDHVLRERLPGQTLRLVVVRKGKREAIQVPLL